MIVSIFLAVVCTPVLTCLCGSLLTSVVPHPSKFRENFFPLMFCNSIIVLILGIYFYGKRQMGDEKRLARMESEKLRFQFEALKSQINPHFLFNSLNVLSALAYQDADKTNLFAKKLSSVYRYLLTTQDQMKVPLQSEFDFTNSYIFLEQIRFGETLIVRAACNKSALGKQIMPASIQMLVENALKHNINTAQSPLQIGIRIASETMTVTNNLQLRPSISRDGRGLQNLRKQYHIHGSDIEATQTAKQFRVRLPLL